MKQLIGVAAAALTLTAGAAAGADARAQDRVLFTVAPRGTVLAPSRLAPGAHTVVLRNRTDAARRLRILRIPGGIAALPRFEGMFLLPASTRVVSDLGTVRPHRVARVRVRLRPGSYVLAALDGIAVAAARPLTVRPAPLRLAPLAHGYVARVIGTRAFVGLSAGPGIVRAYVCDGTATRRATISQWLVGRWDGLRPTTLRAGGVELRLDPIRADGRIVGSVRARAASGRFVLRPVKGPAGLYDGAAGGQRATTVVLADGRYRGAMVDPRPRKCRPVQVTLADGTTEIVTVCKFG
jgi:hypothetical protein